MSDPTWASRVLVSGEEATLYVQGAGVATAVAAADVLAFVTDVSIEVTGERTEKGPWLNYGKKKRTSAGVSYGGSATIDWSKAADTLRATVVNAAISQTRLKFTILLYASGDRFVLDQAFVDATISVAAAEGVTSELTFESDTLVYTAATA